VKRTTKIKIVKENSGTITIKMVSLNRKMPVKREDFMKRIKDGSYEVLNKADYEELCTIKEDEEGDES